MKYRIRNTMLLSLFAVFSCLLPACDEKPKPLTPTTVMRTTQQGAELSDNDKFDFSVAHTVGNGTWIPINKPYLHATLIWREVNPEDPTQFKVQEPNNTNMPVKLLEVIAAFERKHPELDVYDRHIEWQQEAHGSVSFCFGIYLFHRPR